MFCQLDSGYAWYRGGEHLIIVCSASWILAMVEVVSILLLRVLPAGFLAVAGKTASWISGYGIGVVSILLLRLLPAGFLAMAGNTASWISGYGIGVVSILLLCVLPAGFWLCMV